MKRVAIDVGGTFTDVLVLDEAGAIRGFKCATTPGDPSIGLINGLAQAAKGYARPLNEFAADIELLLHGTTLATNALLTGRGARVGMLTTENFRDVTELRKGFKNIRTSMYNVFVPPYAPLVPRYRRLGVKERTLYTGKVEIPLDEAETRKTLRELKADGVDSLAICFLHSYVNPANEQAAVRLAREELSGAHIVASHEILPVWGEFERFSTTIVSASLGLIVGGYLGTLERRLKDIRFGGTLLLVQSDGLVQTALESRRRAVYLLSSGPAAAPSAAGHWGRALNQENLISIDMGGTSLDVCMIRKGVIPTTTESWVGEERVGIKMVEVHSIGAGGGSLGWIDPLGLLRVGPKSAGAEPGPACYDRGGTEPAVTDADLLLGYVPHDYFLGGEIVLKPELAGAAMEKIGSQLNMDAAQAAQAMFTTVNSMMADQIRELSTKRGHDVRDFTLVGGGGAGPVHAAAIADLVGIPKVLIPRFSGLFSAFGMFAMDIGRSYIRSHVRRWKAVELDPVNRLFEEMEQEGKRAFAELGALAAGINTRIKVARSADLRYQGQFHEIEVPLEGYPVSAEVLAQAAAQFHRRHKELYNFADANRPLEFLGCRTTVTAARAPFSTPPIAVGGKDASQAIKRRRRCLFDGKAVETPCYASDRLAAGNVIDGPAVIEEATTTVLVHQSWRCTVDTVGNYLLEKQA